MNKQFGKGNLQYSPNMPQITLWPPGACPPESTTPTLSGLVAAGSADGTSDAEGWPNRQGNSLAISSASDRKPANLSRSHEIQREPCERRVHSPGLPAAELAGPSTTAKLEWRTEGRGSACRSRLVCTSLYTEASRPGAGPFAAPLDVTAAAAMREIWEWESGVWFGENMLRASSVGQEEFGGRGASPSWRFYGCAVRSAGPLVLRASPWVCPCSRFGDSGPRRQMSRRPESDFAVSPKRTYVTTAPLIFIFK